MTKRDYEAIARAIRLARQTVTESNRQEVAKYAANAALTIVADNIANAAARDNSKFQRARFLTECGVGS